MCVKTTVFSDWNHTFGLFPRVKITFGVHECNGSDVISFRVYVLSRTFCDTLLLFVTGITFINLMINHFKNKYLRLFSIFNKTWHTTWKVFCASHLPLCEGIIDGALAKREGNSINLPLRERIGNMATSTVWDSEVLDIYFQDIADAEPLPAEKEAELARQIRACIEGDRNERVAANLRFLVRVATEYQNCGLPIEDLISAGNVGLIQAAERFDENREFKFITYAHWWIRQAIYNAITQESRLVSLPANRVKLLNSITKLLKQLGYAQVTDPSTEFIAKELGVSAEMVEDTLMRAQDVCSLDTSGDGDEPAPIAVVKGESLESPDLQVSEFSDKKLLKRVLSTLDDREAQVLRLQFGLEDREPFTLARIGKRLGLTKERVRQIKEKALGKLRHPRRRAHLAKLIEVG